MKFRFVTEDVLIVSHHDGMDTNLNRCNDFKFNITVSELSRNTEMLRALNLVSMYANEDNAVEFFTNYLNAFTNAKPDLESDTLLQVMVTGRDHQRAVLETDFIKALAEKVL